MTPGLALLQEARATLGGQGRWGGGGVEGQETCRKEVMEIGMYRRES